jgi:hypothetical protein
MMKRKDKGHARTGPDFGDISEDQTPDAIAEQVEAAYASENSCQARLHEILQEMRVSAGRRAAEAGGAGGEARDQLVNTLTNLIHYAGPVGVDFEDALEAARGHYAAELPELRRARYEKLRDYYRSERARDDDPYRYAACSKDRGDEFAGAGWISTHATEEQAFAELADEALNGMVIDAVYDLDTGERIEGHVSTPVVTRSEDQRMMINPLAPEAGKTGGGDQ